jgi:hypothetical protein
MLKIALTFLFVVIPVLSHGTTDKEPVSKRKGVKPLLGGGCPADYPIKGNFTTYSGERCIYHLPGQRFYNKTNAERCYANEANAKQDGCRKAKV